MEHTFYFAEAECDQCDKHFEGNASDVSEAIWHHEADDGHDVHIVREWQKKVEIDQDTGEVIESTTTNTESGTD